MAAIEFLTKYGIPELIVVAVALFLLLYKPFVTGTYTLWKDSADRREKRLSLLKNLWGNKNDEFLLQAQCDAIYGSVAPINLIQHLVASKDPYRNLQDFFETKHIFKKNTQGDYLLPKAIIGSCGEQLWFKLSRWGAFWASLLMSVMYIFFALQNLDLNSSKSIGNSLSSFFSGCLYLIPFFLVGRNLELHWKAKDLVNRVGDSKTTLFAFTD